MKRRPARNAHRYFQGMELKEIINKAIYWIFCTLLIIFVFVIIFLGGFILSEKGLKSDSFVSLLFGTIGSILVILSLYKPVTLLGMAKRPSLPRKKEFIRGISIFHMIFGFSFIIGGLCYIKYSHHFVLLLFILLPMAIIQLLFKRKE